MTIDSWFVIYVDTRQTDTSTLGDYFRYFCKGFFSREICIGNYEIKWPDELTAQSAAGNVGIELTTLDNESSLVCY